MGGGGRQCPGRKIKKKNMVLSTYRKFLLQSSRTLQKSHSIALGVAGTPMEVLTMEFPVIPRTTFFHFWVVLGIARNSIVRTSSFTIKFPATPRATLCHF